MKCDLHVHTIYSGMCTVPVARSFCRESYSQPTAVYERLKRLGMDFVTITDHDSIDGCEELRTHPDFFVSEEVTVTMPSGAEAHVGVYDITDRDHVEIQKRRNDFESLIVYLQRRHILFGINHVFSALTGDRHLVDYRLFEQYVPCMEVRNGAMLPRVNRYAAELASRLSKSPTAGSDAHTIHSVGHAWTEVHDVRTKKEFLEGIRAGRGLACGADGSYWKLTREVARICASLIKERPSLFPLTPLAMGIPLAILVNYWSEVAFAERWFGRVTCRESAPLTPIPGEVSA